MKNLSSLSSNAIASAKGFSLLEVAVVLVILGMLMGSLIVPLSAQRENNQRQTAMEEVEEIKKAILGFMLVNGRFPCPSSAGSAGVEQRNGGTGACTTLNGFVPNVTLGLSGDLTANNLLADPWGQAYRYSLSGVNSWEYSNNVSIGGTTPDVQVCTAVACGANQVLTASGVAIILSTAKSGIPTATSTLEAENTDNDSTFIKATFSAASGSEFDDVVTWISQNEVAYALMKSGYVN